MTVWRRVLRAWAYALALCTSVVLAVQPTYAAELKISYAELSAVVRAVLGDAKLHLHNKPAALFDLSTGSYFTIAGKQFDLPLPLKSFNVLGSTYAYYVENFDSQTITAEPVRGAVRLRLTFVPKTMLQATCISGDCSLTGALPRITWREGSVTIDVIPVHVGLSLALQVKDVKIGGNFSVGCYGAGVFSSGACSLALGYAKRTVANLKPEIAANIKTNVNDAASQGKVADSLKSYLKVGDGSVFDVTGVSADNTTVRVAFKLIEPAGG